MAFFCPLHARSRRFLRGGAAAFLFGMLVAACGKDVLVETSSDGGTGGTGGTQTSSSSGVGGSAQSSSSSSSVTGSGGFGGGLPKQKNCFVWPADAGPCPPKDQAIQ